MPLPLVVPILLANVAVNLIGQRHAQERGFEEEGIRRFTLAEANQRQGRSEETHRLNARAHDEWRMRCAREEATWPLNRSAAEIRADVRRDGTGALATVIVERDKGVHVQNVVDLVVKPYFSGSAAERSGCRLETGLWKQGVPATDATLRFVYDALADVPLVVVKIASDGTRVTLWTASWGGGFGSPELLPQSRQFAMAELLRGAARLRSAEWTAHAAPMLAAAGISAEAIDALGGDPGGGNRVRLSAERALRESGLHAAADELARTYRVDERDEGAALEELGRYVAVTVAVLADTFRRAPGRPLGSPAALREIAGDAGAVLRGELPVVVDALRDAVLASCPVDVLALTELSRAALLLGDVARAEQFLLDGAEALSAARSPAHAGARTWNELAGALERDALAADAAVIGALGACLIKTGRRDEGRRLLRLTTRLVPVA